MKNLLIATLGLVAPLSGQHAQAAEEGPNPASKVVKPVRLPGWKVKTSPYKFNGVVMIPGFRGSGFSAWDNRTFFTAGHMVFDAGNWTPPPTWYGNVHQETVNEKEAVQSRGYYRWVEYAELATDPESTGEEFGKDVALAYSFESVVKDRPARLNKNGATTLTSKDRADWMVTGYPAQDPYHEKPIDGFYLYQTGPTNRPLSYAPGKAVQTTNVTTGPGNSGGPVWTLDNKKGWEVSGVLVGGLGGETVIYPFSSSVDRLLRSVTPVLQKRIGKQVWDPGVSGSSYLGTNYEVTDIPDGVAKYTSFKIGVDRFETGEKLTSVKLSLNIRTKHRGDLIVVLEGPNGVQTLITKEQGATKNNLILDRKDFTEAFSDTDANGFWYIRVQDRLPGDKATFKSAVLEISTDGGNTTTP